MKIYNDTIRGAVLAVDDADGVAISDVVGSGFDDVPDILKRWNEFRNWAESAATAIASAPRVPLSELTLAAPSPTPSQVFAIGLNYDEHAAESGFERPIGIPPTFTKFASCITGPATRIRIPDGGTVDWEVELVVVIGRGGRNILAEDALAHVAGVTIGQDYSERTLQRAGPAPQFGPGKSFEGFGPTGPALVTLDELEEHGALDSLELQGRVNGEVMQSGDTGQMIFTIPELIVFLSSFAELRPGDLIFTGTPAGVGAAMNPPRYLQPGDVVESRIQGLGTMTQTFTA